MEKLTRLLLNLTMIGIVVYSIATNVIGVSKLDLTIINAEVGFDAYWVALIASAVIGLLFGLLWAFIARYVLILLLGSPFGFLVPIGIIMVLILLLNEGYNLLSR